MNEAPDAAGYRYNDPREEPEHDVDEAARAIRGRWRNLAPELVRLLAEAYQAGDLPDRWDSDIAKAINEQRANDV